jgi:hypothetical protein
VAQGDGARKDVLRWVTHGPSGAVFDAYTTLPWPALCEAVGCLKVSVKEGKVVAIRPVAEVAGVEELGAQMEPGVSAPDADKERAASSLACGP